MNLKEYSHAATPATAHKTPESKFQLALALLASDRM